jgi:tetratricopeptide (TPR) repeat protein
MLMPTSPIIPVTSRPTAPQNFFGREAELSHIIEAIFNNGGSCSARIAVLGPIGYGKTTLASAVLSHDRVAKHFSDARYFVTCESASTPSALRIEIARALGILDGSNVSWSYIYAFLNAQESILCLDHFDSPWDQASDIKASIEDLLLRMAELHSVTLLITMRGIERPARVNWTEPMLAPLKTLDYHAAKMVWKHIANDYDGFAKKLLKAVDYVPLAVTLLAYLAQFTSPALLWDEWNIKHTELVKTGQHRLSNLNSSIQLSLNSSRMRSNSSAQNLLGILSVLPDGIHLKQLERFEKIFDNLDVKKCLEVLQNCGLIQIIRERYQIYPIIYQFCNNQRLLLQKHEAALTDFYLTLASLDIHKAGSNHSEMMLEFINTKSILTKILQSNYKSHSLIVNAILSFMKFCMSIGDYSDDLICNAIKFMQQHNAATPLLVRCLQYWGKLLYHINDINNAKLKLEEAEKLCLLDVNTEKILYAGVIIDLGNIFMYESAYTKAKALYERALQIYEAIDNDNYNIGQANCYCRLADIYLKLKELNSAEAWYEKALNLHMALKDNIGQGNDYRGLGDTFILLNKLDEAQASYERALELDKAVNSLRGQAKDYKRLGNIFTKLKKFDDAEVSLNTALKLYKAVNTSLGQGNTLYDLGKLYLKRSQLDKAKTTIKSALYMHKQAQDKGGEMQDLKLLEEVISKMV